MNNNLLLCIRAFESAPLTQMLNTDVIDMIISEYIDNYHSENIYTYEIFGNDDNVPCFSNSLVAGSTDELIEKMLSEYNIISFLVRNISPIMEEILRNDTRSRICDVDLKILQDIHTCIENRATDIRYHGYMKIVGGCVKELLKIDHKVLRSIFVSLSPGCFILSDSHHMSLIIKEVEYDEYVILYLLGTPVI